MPPPKIPSFLRPADTFKAPVPRSHAAEEGFPCQAGPRIHRNFAVGSVGMDPLDEDLGRSMATPGSD